MPGRAAARCAAAAAIARRHAGAVRRRCAARRPSRSSPAPRCHSRCRRTPSAAACRRRRRAARDHARPAAHTPAALVAAIAAAGAPVAARLGGDPGAPSLVLSRRDGAGAGRITVFANAAYGFPVATMAREPRHRHAALPGGAAFFAQGGRRAWVVRMGDPLPYLAPRDGRFGQLAALLARGGGGGAFGRDRGRRRARRRTAFAARADGGTFGPRPPVRSRRCDLRAAARPS